MKVDTTQGHEVRVTPWAGLTECHLPSLSLCLPPGIPTPSRGCESLVQPGSPFSSSFPSSVVTMGADQAPGALGSRVRVLRQGGGKISPQRPPHPPHTPAHLLPKPAHYLNGQLGGGCGWPGEARGEGFEGEAHWHSGPAPPGSAVHHPRCPRAPRLMENGTWAMEIEEEWVKGHEEIPERGCPASSRTNVGCWLWLTLLPVSYSCPRHQP